MDKIKNCDHFNTKLKENVYLIGNYFGDEEYSIQKKIVEETIKEFNVKYFEISCNNGTGIEELMTSIIIDNKLWEKEDEKSLRINSENLNKTNKKNNKIYNIY